MNNQTFQTVDELRRAQNALKRKTILPLPVPLSVQIEKPVNPELFFVSRENFMTAPWSLVLDRINDKVMEHPVFGLQLDQRTQEEFANPSLSFDPCTLSLLRYDLEKKYIYSDLKDQLPDEAIFESNAFEQVLVIFLQRGIGQGRSFLRGAFHSNLFLVHSRDGQRILSIRVSWSYKQVSATSIEGWKIETETFEIEKHLRYKTSLYTYSHLAS